MEAFVYVFVRVVSRIDRYHRCFAAEEEADAGLAVNGVLGV